MKTKINIIQELKKRKNEILQEEKHLKEEKLMILSNLAKTHYEMFNGAEIKVENDKELNESLNLFYLSVSSVQSDKDNKITINYSNSYMTLLKIDYDLLNEKCVNALIDIFIKDFEKRL